MSLIEELGAQLYATSAAVPIGEVAAALERLRATSALLMWVRTESSRPMGVPQLASATEHLEDAGRAMRVAQEAIGEYLAALGLGLDAGVPDDAAWREALRERPAPPSAPTPDRPHRERRPDASGDDSDQRPQPGSSPDAARGANRGDRPGIGVPDAADGDRQATGAARPETGALGAGGQADGSGAGADGSGQAGDGAGVGGARPEGGAAGRPGAVGVGAGGTAAGGQSAGGGARPGAGAGAGGAQAGAGGRQPLGRWWAARVAELTGGSAAGAAGDPTPLQVTDRPLVEAPELLRRVARLTRAGDRDGLRRELTATAPPTGLALAAIAPPVLYRLAGELLGHQPRAADLPALERAAHDPVAGLLPELPEDVTRTLLARVCRVPPPERPGPPAHPADPAVAGAVLVGALLQRLGRDPESLTTDAPAPLPRGEDRR